MGRIKLLTIVGGIALVVFGVQEWRLASGASQEPQAISCADLAAKGPGTNAHVALGDYLLCKQSFVYESRSKSDNSRWSKVWIPVVPIDGEYVQQIKALLETDGNLNGPMPMPKDVRVLLKTSKVTGEPDLDALGTSGALTGVVTNKIESLGTKEREMLEESYPGIDFTKCYILEHERKPAGAAKVAGMVGGGALLSLVGGFWMLAGFRKSA